MSRHPVLPAGGCNSASAKHDQSIKATWHGGSGRVTLEAAIRAGDLATATDLVRSGVDVNRSTPEGLTP